MIERRRDCEGARVPSPLRIMVWFPLPFSILFFVFRFLNFFSLLKPTASIPREDQRSSNNYTTVPLILWNYTTVSIFLLIINWPLNSKKVINWPLIFWKFYINPCLQFIFNAIHLTLYFYLFCLTFIIWILSFTLLLLFLYFFFIFIFLNII